MWGVYSTSDEENMTGGWTTRTILLSTNRRLAISNSPHGSLRRRHERRVMEIGLIEVIMATSAIGR